MQRDIKKVKLEYCSWKIEENKNNPQKLWEQLKSLGYSTKQKENAKVVLDIDKEHCHDSNVIANYINHFFTNVASTLVSKLPPCPKLFDFNSDIFKQFYKLVLENNLHLDLSPVTEDEKLNHRVRQYWWSMCTSKTNYLFSKCIFI